MYNYSYILGTVTSMETGDSGNMKIEISNAANEKVTPIMITNELYEIIKDVVNIGDKIGIKCYTEPSELDPDSVTLWGENVSVYTPLCTVSGRDFDDENSEA